MKLTFKMALISLVCIAAGFTVVSGAFAVEAAGPTVHRASSRPAQQTQVTLHLKGVNAIQLAWWFQHMADEEGRYWKPLAAANESITWRVNPREDAHQLIGALFTSDQRIGKGVFANDVLHTQAQFQDYVTSRHFVANEPSPLNPTMGVPADYTPPYPSPVAETPKEALDITGRPENNGFNQQLILYDGKGYSQGRILISWKNVGNDDTAATEGQPYAVDLSLTLYEVWMEGPNRPPVLSKDGLYYTDGQRDALLAVWRDSLAALPSHLPAWFNADTQDDLARAKGYTVGAEIDTGFVEGVDSKMMVWWWNHAMGDEPGINYSLWCPPAHYAIRWLPGYSPAEILGSATVPDDRVIPGTIYPDLQGDHLEQDGGGMMAYPPEMSPIPGKYKTIDPMMIVSKAQVDNFASVRFPEPPIWLLHQWEDRPGGLIHRSSVLLKLPLRQPVTQQGYYSEHQLMEGQFWGTGGMRKAYAQWQAAKSQ